MKLVRIALFGVIVLAASTQAAVVVTTNTVAGNYTTAFPVSSTDLINAGQLTLLGSSHTGYTPVNNALGISTTDALNDGTAGTINPPAAGSVDEVAADLDGIWVSTFQFDTNAFPQGFVLTNITTIAAWIPSRATQKYEVQYSTFLSPSTFVSLGTFALITELDGSSRIQLTDTTGELAKGVSALRFNVLDPAITFNHPAAYKEWDVFGFPLPEPSSALLMALAMGVFLRSRRR